MSGGTIEFVLKGIAMGLDGLVFLMFALGAGLLLRHDRLATVLLGVAALMRAGGIGLALMVQTVLPNVIQSLMDQGLYDAIPWLFGVEAAVFRSSEALQWVFVCIAVFRGRTGRVEEVAEPVPEPRPKPEEPPLEPMVAPSELAQVSDATTVLTDRMDPP